MAMAVNTDIGFGISLLSCSTPLISRRMAVTHTAQYCICTSGALSPSVLDVLRTHLLYGPIVRNAAIHMYYARVNILVVLVHQYGTLAASMATVPWTRANVRTV
eukprot:scpid95872/ scgid13761/ 